jgi:hypothetical protein
MVAEYESLPNVKMMNCKRMVQTMMQKIERNERSSEETYANIIAKIKIMYKDKITEAEASEAARNLIGFCQEILNYKLEKQRELKNKEQKRNLIDLSRKII